MCRFILGHKWGKWSDEKPGFSYVYYRGIEIKKTPIIVQERRCKKCNEVELRQVGGM